MISSLVRPASEGYPDEVLESAELLVELAEGSNGSVPEFGDDVVGTLVDELSLALLALLLELLLLEVLSQAVSPNSSRA